MTAFAYLPYHFCLLIIIKAYAAIAFPEFQKSLFKYSLGDMIKQQFVKFFLFFL